MADEILKDRHGIRYGKVTTDARGNAAVYDKMNLKLGTIRPDSMGNLIAYDKMNRKLAVYDSKQNYTKDTKGRRLGKGNLLLNVFFQ